MSLVPGVLGGKRSILQHRNSISNALQPGLDGMATLGIANALINFHIGYHTVD